MVSESTIAVDDVQEEETLSILNKLRGNRKKQILGPTAPTDLLLRAALFFSSSVHSLPDGLLRRHS